MDTDKLSVSGSSRFCDLVERVRAGNDGAFGELASLCADRLVAAIRHNVLPAHDPLRREFDPEDLMQRGWRVLFTALARGTRFGDAEHLIGYILAALRNFLNSRRREHAGPGGGALPPDVHFDPALHDQADVESGPVEQVELAEEGSIFLATLNPADHAVMLQVGAGHDPKAIAEALGCSVRTVQRCIKHSYEAFLNRSSKDVPIPEGDSAMIDNTRPMPPSSANELATKEMFYCAHVAQNPTSVEGWYQFGLVAMGQKNHALAIERLTNAAKLDLNQADCYLKLGLCHLAMGQAEQAMADFVRFTQRRPKDADGHNNLGISFAQLGRRDEAAACFEQALYILPGFAQAHCNLGNVLAARGNEQGAAVHYQKAIELNPGYAEAHHHLGQLLVQHGQAERGIASLRQAVTLNPGYVQALCDLAAACRTLGRLDEAIALYRQLLKGNRDHAHAAGYLAELLTTQNKHTEAVAVLHQSLLFQPNAPGIYHMLGMIMKQQGQYEEAAAAFGHTIRLQPSNAGAHNVLANVLLKLERGDEAIARYGQAIALKPDYAEAHGNLGTALSLQDRLEESLGPLGEAVRLDPNYADGHHNRATSYRRLGRFEDAIAGENRTLELQPKHADAHCGLGAALPHVGRFAESAACFERAIELRPQHPDYHTNLGILSLLLGNWERGLEEYEWRLKQRSVKPRLAPQPMWDGRPMPGGTILLYAEQGLGDTIMIARYIRMVKARVGTVLLECPSALASLLADCPGVDGIVDPTGPAPAADAQLPLMSLPRVFGTRPNTIPAGGPYLFSEPRLRERWRKVINTDTAGPSFKVGTVWQGNTKHPGDAFRSVKLAQFAPLAAVPGVRLCSLQKGAGAEQIAGLNGQFEVIDLGGQFGPEFRDAAAAMENLDLVIAVDTSLAHLVGALGLPVWVLTPFYPDWRWQLKGETSAWYPTARLLRQKTSGAWDGVFGRTAAAMGEFASMAA